VTPACCFSIWWWRRGAVGRKRAAEQAPATASAGAAAAAADAPTGLDVGAPDKIPPAVGDLIAAVRRKGASAAAAVDDSAPGPSGDQQASEANEAAADSSGQNAPGEPLVLETGAAAAATKDLDGSMLGEAARAQRGDVSDQDERPANGALVGVHDGALVGPFSA
jgi:hypothetical protein